MNGNFQRTTKLVYSIDETLEELGITRPTLYKLINSGQLKTKKIGRRRIVPGFALMNFINSVE